MKHTKGPWHVGDTNPNFSPKIYAPDGYLVADCANILVRDKEQSQANANLISAAPVLIAELIETEKALMTAIEMLTGKKKKDQATIEAICQKSFKARTLVQSIQNG